MHTLLSLTIASECLGVRELELLLQLRQTKANDDRGRYVVAEVMCFHKDALGVTAWRTGGTRARARTFGWVWRARTGRVWEGQVGGRSDRRRGVFADHFEQRMPVLVDLA